MMAERILFHRTDSADKAESILRNGFQRTSGDQYGVGLWTCSDENMFVAGPVQFKLRVTYQLEANEMDVPEARRQWNGDPHAVDAVYEAKGIEVVQVGELNFLVRKGPIIEIIAYRMLEPEQGPWRPLDQNDPASTNGALAEIRSWWPLPNYRGGPKE